MTTHGNYLLTALALAALTPTAWAEKDVEIRHVKVDSPHHITINTDIDKSEKESVTYLGVSTVPMDPTLGDQLGLPEDIGLIVNDVMDKSPAAEILKKHDVLTKLDDQILIDVRQLSVLVRAKKAGDEVKLTLVRGGKEMSVKVKLGTHEVPKHANAFFYRNGGMGLLPMTGGLPGLTFDEKLPGMGPDDARDVLRMIEHERGNFLIGPGVRIMNRAGKGSTIVDLPKSNISYSDDDGSIEIKVDDGKRNLTVKNAKGAVAFNGPINTAEERAKLPPEVSKRLEKLETDTISFETDPDFQPETIPLPTEPAKTKIRHPLDGETAPPVSRSLRTL